MKQQMMALLEDVGERRAFPERLVVKSSGRVVFIRVDDIEWIDAAGNYVFPNLANGNYRMLDIAILLGFADQSSFTRSFLRWFDMTPSQWQRDHNKNKF